MTVLEMIQDLEGKKDNLLESLWANGGVTNQEGVAILNELKKVYFVLSYLKSQLEGHELEVMEIIDVE